MNCENAFKWVGGLKETYQPVEGFPDKIKPERVEGFKKILGIITNHIGDVGGKRIIDIGCNFGWFDLELAKLGASVVGYEFDGRRAQVARCLAERGGLDARFIDGDAVKLINTAKPNCDYVLLLNTFHHLLLQDELNAWGMFNHLIDNSKGVFIMMRNGLKNWRLCDRRTDIPKAIIERSHATGYIDYGVVHGRNVYFLYRNE